MTWGKAAISMVSLTSLQISKPENQQGDDHDAEREEITNCMCIIRWTMMTRMMMMVMMMMMMKRR